MWHDILMVVIGLIPGLVIGFFVARKLMTKYLKKNPHGYCHVNLNLINDNEKK